MFPIISLLLLHETFIVDVNDAQKRPLLVFHREEALNLDILFKLADYLQDH